MADISAIKPTGASGASYNIKDATARTNINTLNNNVSALGGRVTGLDTRVTALENAGGSDGRTWGINGEISDDLSTEFPEEYRGYGEDYWCRVEITYWSDDSGSWEQINKKAYGVYDSQHETIITDFPSSFSSTVEMPKIKIGDIVICEENYGYWAQVNQSQDWSSSTIGYVWLSAFEDVYYMITGFFTKTFESDEYPGHYNTIKYAKLMKQTTQTLE